MSESAPELIWVWEITHLGGKSIIGGRFVTYETRGSIAYRRADIAHLPGELVERLNQARIEMINEGVNGWPNVIGDVLDMVWPRYTDADFKRLDDAKEVLAAVEGKA